MTTFREDVGFGFADFFVLIAVPVELVTEGFSTVDRFKIGFNTPDVGLVALSACARGICRVKDSGC